MYEWLGALHIVSILAQTLEDIYTMLMNEGNFLKNH